MSARLSPPGPGGGACRTSGLGPAIVRGQPASVRFVRLVSMEWESAWSSARYIPRLQALAFSASETELGLGLWAACPRLGVAGHAASCRDARSGLEGSWCERRATKRCARHERALVTMSGQRQGRLDPVTIVTTLPGRCSPLFSRSPCRHRSSFRSFRIRAAAPCSHEVKTRTARRRGTERRQCAALRALLGAFGEKLAAARCPNALKPYRARRKRRQGTACARLPIHACRAECLN